MDPYNDTLRMGFRAMRLSLSARRELPPEAVETWFEGLPEVEPSDREFEAPPAEAGYAKLQRANMEGLYRKHLTKETNPVSVFMLAKLYEQGSIKIVDPVAEGRAAARARRFRYSNWKGR